MSIQPELSRHMPKVLCLTLVTLAGFVASECYFAVSAPLLLVTGPTKRQNRDEGSHDHAGHGERAVNRKNETARANPATYQEAVAAVVAMNETMRRSFASRNDDAAHGPLHKIDPILKEINVLAAAAELTGAQRRSVQISVARLFEAFRVVDGTMHGEEGLCYEEVSLEIEEHLEILKTISTI